MKRTVSRPGCPDSIALTRAVTQGPDEALAAHIGSCDLCAGEWHAEQDLVRLGTNLPIPPFAPHDRDRIKNALLSSASRQHSTRPRFGLPSFVFPALAGAAAMAIVAAVSVRLWRPAGPDAVAAYHAASRAIVEAEPGARYTQIAEAPNEVYRLYEGKVRFTVTPAVHGETFRVVTGAGEVEVRGTIFETTAKDDELVKVDVQRGRVVVRTTTTAPELSLVAGEGWTRVADEPLEAPADAAPPAPARLAPGHRRSGLVSHEGGARVADPAEQAFGQGLSLLRAADAMGAARAFQRATLLAPRGTLAEDASYWRAVALARAGEKGGGHEALVAFLDRFPRSARAGEASVMLGWMLLDRNELEAASARFEVGLVDPSTRVRKSARAGLDAVADKVTKSGVARLGVAAKPRAEKRP